MVGFLGGHGLYVTGMWKRAWEDTVPCHLCLSWAVDAESSGRESDRQRMHREIYGEHLLVTVQQDKWERHDGVGRRWSCVCMVLLCLVTVYTNKCSAHQWCIWKWLDWFCPIRLDVKCSLVQRSFKCLLTQVYQTPVNEWNPRKGM